MEDLWRKALGTVLLVVPVAVVIIGAVMDRLDEGRSVRRAAAHLDRLRAQFKAEAARLQREHWDYLKSHRDEIPADLVDDVPFN